GGRVRGGGGHRVRRGGRALRERRRSRRGDRRAGRERRHRAGQGIAVHADGARRRGARRRPRGERALMLLYLTELLATRVRTFNVFSYITLRAVLATMAAPVISFGV